LELVQATLYPAAPLLGMPFLPADPLGGLRLEDELGPLGLAAAVDAVAAVHLGFDLLERHVLRLGFERIGALDRVEGKPKQALSTMTVRIEVPGVAVVDETLRGHVALAHRASSAGQVAHSDA